MAFAIIKRNVVLVGSWLPSFRDSLSAFCSSVKQSKETGQLGYSENSKIYDQATPADIPEDRRHQLRHVVSLETRSAGLWVICTKRKYKTILCFSMKSHTVTITLKV